MTTVTEVSVFFDGFDHVPRLSHPEGVAVHTDGSVWCGSETGELFRINPEGSGFEVVAVLGGFLLGIAFDNQGNIYVCNQQRKTVVRVAPEGKDMIDLYVPGDGPSLPNYPVVDVKRNRLYVSDSRRESRGEASIWTVDLDGAGAEPWSTHPFAFANGMALSQDGTRLFVAATWDRAVFEVAITPSGQPGRVSIFAENLPGLPDGIALTHDGDLVVSCYEPSQILHINQNGEAQILLHDETAHLMCHPTNVAFRGSELFTANLGRWHITRLLTDLRGPLSSFPKHLTNQDG
jgi:sugar lactone lactonase YvrE